MSLERDGGMILAGETEELGKKPVPVSVDLYSGSECKCNVNHEVYMGLLSKYFCYASLPSLRNGISVTMHLFTYVLTYVLDVQFHIQAIG
jgi:hypothetical protein